MCCPRLWQGSQSPTICSLDPTQDTGAAKEHIEAMRTVVLLLISNLFMTAAWYGHLKYKNAPLFKVILVSWLIAFVEYCFQVPANRIGHGQFTAAQLKTIQEAVSLLVFSGFSVLYLREELRWNYLLGFLLIVAAVFVIFRR
jgi:uncharacterized protein (DUF486 family)